MKTLIDLDEGVLKDVLRMTKAKTKKEAVNTAMKEYVRVQSLKEFAAKLGEIEWDMTLEELEKSREDEHDTTW